MQVVLTQNVKNIGHKGDIKNVKDGYFQNYLLPNRLAEIATPAKIREAENIRKHQLLEKDRITEQAQEIQQKMKGLTISIKAKSRGDKLYGSITEKEVIDALQQKINVRLDKQHLHLSEHIKTIGDYEIPVRLAEGVEAKFTLEVKAEK